MLAFILNVYRCQWNPVWEEATGLLYLIALFTDDKCLDASNVSSFLWLVDVHYESFFWEKWVTNHHGNLTNTIKITPPLPVHHLPKCCKGNSLIHSYTYASDQRVKLICLREILKFTQCTCSLDGLFPKDCKTLMKFYFIHY